MTENNLISFVLGCIGNKILKHRQLKKFRRLIIETQEKIDSEPIIFMFTDEQRGEETRYYGARGGRKKGQKNKVVSN